VTSESGFAGLRSAPDSVLVIVVNRRGQLNSTTKRFDDVHGRREGKTSGSADLFDGGSALPGHDQHTNCVLHVDWNGHISNPVRIRSSQAATFTDHSTGACEPSRYQGRHDRTEDLKYVEHDASPVALDGALRGLCRKLVLAVGQEAESHYLPGSIDQRGNSSNAIGRGC
jgi:hypothetical protein